ncbi:MAG: hypothetical protein NTV84_04250 [Methanoregula sp.]|nr:hypothetical protein [Methanoregula sp.]
MKLKSLGFGFLVFLIVGISLVSAVTVSDPVINPTGDLTSGTNVSVSFKIDMTPAGGLTFPEDNTLQIFTDLNSPQWTSTLIRDGVEHPQPVSSSRSMYLSGWILSYPSSVQESLRVTLQGMVPTVTKSMNKTIVLVQELDGKNTIIPASITTRERLIVNPTDLSQSIALRESDLRTFRTHIDNYAQMGVNTTAAEQNFASAQASILSAKTANFATAQASLNSATGQIDDGEKVLDRALAERDINNAQVPISQTSDLIVFFTVNKRITTDPRLAIVIAKKESADQYLSSARDLFATGNYAFSRVKAKAAFDKGNESLTDAINFKLALTNTGSTPGVNWLTTNNLIIIGVVVVIIIAGVAGYFLMRKKNRWEDN